MKHLLQQLQEHGISITGLDHGGLTLMAWTYHHWVEANERVRKEGYIVREKNARGTAITKVHPAVKIVYDCNAQLRQLMVEYGLTPKSRGKVDAIQGNLFEHRPELAKFKVVE